MKLGVFTVLFKEKSFEEMLDYVVSKKLDAIEIGTGGYIGKPHCEPGELLKDEVKLKAYKEAIDSRGLTISALSCHGNPLHPQQALAEPFKDEMIKTIELASKLGVPTVVNFSGCPGDHEGAKYPNWPVAPWPPDYQEILEWQWEHKIIPYWKEVGKFAEDSGVNIAIEMHGGFSVHTPATLLKLREAVGPVIGANLDPSHMWWQGIDPVEATRILGQAEAIYHFHAKDTSIDPVNINRYGLTDMQRYSRRQDRAWQFRTVGYGHDEKDWADIISALRLAGYEGAISIEHEDGLMSVDEGFTKAVDNLLPLIMKESVGEMWWV
jgi:sugar phosphate isomerase/epimerase